MAGEMQVPAGSYLTFNGGAYIFTTNGFLNAASGGVVEYRAGNMTFDAGLTLSSTVSNWITGNVYFFGTASLPNFTLVSGSLGGDFINTGTLRWTGGTMGGTLTWPVGGC